MQIQQKSIKDGNFYIPGTILKWFGHCFIDFEHTQLGRQNEKFLQLSVCGKNKIL